MDFPPTEFYQAKKVDSLKFVKGRRYIACTGGRIVTCVCRHKGDAKQAPIFLPSGSSMAYELKLFDWIMEIP